MRCRWYSSIRGLLSPTQPHRLLTMNTPGFHELKMGENGARGQPTAVEIAAPDRQTRYPARISAAAKIRRVAGSRAVATGSRSRRNAIRKFCRNVLLDRGCTATYGSCASRHIVTTRAHPAKAGDAKPRVLVSSATPPPTFRRTHDRRAAGWNSRPQRMRTVPFTY